MRKILLHLLAKLLFDNQDKIWLEDWEMYIADAEQLNKTTFNHEDRLEIFKQVFLNIENRNPVIKNYNPFGDYRINLKTTDGVTGISLMGVGRRLKSGNNADNIDDVANHHIYNAAKEDVLEKCEYIEKKLFKDESLTGEMLEFVLELIPNTEDKHFNGAKVRDKLKNGEVFDGHELYIVCHFLLHAKIFL